LEKKNNIFILFFIILAANILIYEPSLNAYFVNDDYNWIKPVRFSEVLSTFWGGWGHGALYRPLSRLVLYIEFLLFKDFPIGHSLFLHIM
jgi:hypothetical protein